MPVEALSRGAYSLDEFRHVVLHARVQASQGRRGSMVYRIFRRPPTFGLYVWGLGLWVCDSVFVSWGVVDSFR